MGQLKFTCTNTSNFNLKYIQIKILKNSYLLYKKESKVRTPLLSIELGNLKPCKSWLNYSENQKTLEKNDDFLGKVLTLNIPVKMRPSALISYSLNYLLFNNIKCKLVLL